MARQKSNVGLITAFIAVLIAFGVGFYVGMKFGPTKVVKMTPADLINEGLVENIDSDSIAYYDSIEMAKELRIKHKVDSITHYNERRSDSLRRIRKR